MPRPGLNHASGARSSRRGAFAGGLVLALVLHASGLSLVALLPPWALAPAAPSRSEPSPVALEFELESDVEPGPTSEPPGAAAASGVALPPPRSPPRQVAAVASAASALASRARDGVADTAPAGTRASDAASAAEPGALLGTDDAAVAGAAEKQAVSPHAQASDAPRLSLEALGVGAGHNPFLGPLPVPSARQTLARQVDHVLRSGLAEHDRELGLGPEGPAVALVTDLVMQSEAAPNTSALLGLRTDANGYTVDVEVREASGDTAAWQAIAAELQKKLAGQRLRVPTGTGGVSMQLRVTSRNTLPSGSDPGLAIELFGQEIKSGDGPRSTRLQILTPKIAVQEVEVPYTDGREKVQALTATLTMVGLRGDPVDIGAVARRVVHAYLVALETHPKELEANPALH
jgi:hypothetical protein